MAAVSGSLQLQAIPVFVGKCGFFQEIRVVYALLRYEKEALIKPIFGEGSPVF